jgi:hypothetical protein
MKKMTFEVTQTIEVEFDEKQFSEEFLEVFRECFYPFYDIQDHGEHIAQYYARSGSDDPEGYANPETKMFSCRSLDTDVERVDY